MAKEYLSGAILGIVLLPDVYNFWVLPGKGKLLAKRERGRWRDVGGIGVLRLGLTPSLRMTLLSGLTPSLRMTLLSGLTALAQCDTLKRRGWAPPVKPALPGEWSGLIAAGILFEHGHQAGRDSCCIASPSGRRQRGSRHGRAPAPGRPSPAPRISQGN